MFKRQRLSFVPCIVFILLSFCSTGKDAVKDDVVIKDDVQPQEEREYNFKFTGYDINIDDPDNDRRSYYIILIDKVEAGRTTIGLESQEKTFEYKLSGSRHLLMVEKWALDMKKKKYVKLNNIEQPRPDYKYFTIPEDGAVHITMENDPESRETVYNLEEE